QEVQIEHVQAEPLSARRSVLRAVPLWQLGFLAAIFLWLYWSTLIHLVGQWSHDQNSSHGFFVPLFSAFVIWQERRHLAQILPRPSWSGAFVILAGLALLITGRLVAEIFLDRSSMF